MVSLTTLLFGGIFALVGLGMATIGGNGFRRWRTMRQMEPRDMVVEPAKQHVPGEASGDHRSDRIVPDDQHPSPVAY